MRVPLSLGVFVCETGANVVRCQSTANSKHNSLQPMYREVRKEGKKRRQARWFSSRLYINHTGTHIVLDCQEKKIVPLTALTPTSSPPSSRFYYHHLSAYLFIHLSIQPTSHPSFFPILPNGAVHGCMIETHAAEHHFWFYGPDFRRGGGKGLKKTEAMADLLLAH